MAAPDVEKGSRPEAKGYLVLGIEQASGKNSNDVCCWDTSPTMGMPFEAFVRAELRGGARNVKANTRKVPILDDDILFYEQDLSLEVLEGSSELRLMLCREKYVNGKKGTAVIAACGLFMQDIQEADLPIDKYFELFKPHGGEGGYIRITMNLLPLSQDRGDAAQDDAPAPAAVAEPAPPPAAAATVEPAGATQPASHGRRGLKTALIVLLWAGVVGVAVGASAIKNRKPKNRKAGLCCSSSAQSATSVAAASNSTPLASTPPRSSWWGS